MAALLVAMSIMAIVMSAALPVWQTEARREKEAELIFRGEQYARAIAAFQRKYGNANPPNVGVLLKERFLRRKYTDPITGEDFVLVTPTTQLPGRATPPGSAQRNGDDARTDDRRGPSSIGPGSSSSSRGSGRSASGASQSGGRLIMGQTQSGGRSTPGQTGQRGT